MGQFKVRTTYYGKTYSFPVYEVRGLTVSNLLSRASVAEMGIVEESACGVHANNISQCKLSF